MLAKKSFESRPFTTKLDYTQPDIHHENGHIRQVSRVLGPRTPGETPQLSPDHCIKLEAERQQSKFHQCKRLVCPWLILFFVLAIVETILISLLAVKMNKLRIALGLTACVVCLIIAVIWGFKVLRRQRKEKELEERDIRMKSLATINTELELLTNSISLCRALGKKGTVEEEGFEVLERGVDVVNRKVDLLRAEMASWKRHLERHKASRQHRTGDPQAIISSTSRRPQRRELQLRSNPGIARPPGIAKSRICIPSSADGVKMKTNTKWRLWKACFGAIEQRLNAYMDERSERLAEEKDANRLRKAEEGVEEGKLSGFLVIPDQNPPQPQIFAPQDREELGHETHSFRSRRPIEENDESSAAQNQAAEMSGGLGNENWGTGLGILPSPMAFPVEPSKQGSQTRAGSLISADIREPSRPTKAVLPSQKSWEPEVRAESRKPTAESQSLKSNRKRPQRTVARGIDANDVPPARTRRTIDNSASNETFHITGDSCSGLLGPDTNSKSGNPTSSPVSRRHPNRNLSTQRRKDIRGIESDLQRHKTTQGHPVTPNLASRSLMKEASLEASQKPLSQIANQLHHEHPCEQTPKNRVHDQWLTNSSPTSVRQYQTRIQCEGFQAPERSSALPEGLRLVGKPQAESPILPTGFPIPSQTVSTSGEDSWEADDEDLFTVSKIFRKVQTVDDRNDLLGAFDLGRESRMHIPRRAYSDFLTQSSGSIGPDNDENECTAQSTLKLADEDRRLEHAVMKSQNREIEPNQTESLVGLQSLREAQERNAQPDRMLLEDFALPAKSQKLEIINSGQPGDTERSQGENANQGVDSTEASYAEAGTLAHPRIKTQDFPAPLEWDEIIGNWKSFS